MIPRSWFARFFVACGVLVVATSAFSQTPAFPGALGNGAYVTGGRGGTVYHVTTLADSGAGSFRDAVNGSGRIVVFDVGGKIKLLTAVSAKGNLTIAGQTAPGGICFDGGEISFSSRSNVICRYLRIRPGSDTASSTDDAIAFANGRTMIFDHCSIAFAPWNNVDAVSTSWQTTPCTDITFQHCINADPTGQQFGAHTESVNSYWTWCYNIFANSHNRNPLAKVNNVFINNLEYNCSAGYTTHTSTGFKHDIVNNYFIYGPASGGNTAWFQIDNNQSIYSAGNLLDTDKNGALGGNTTSPLPGYQGGGTILSSPFSSWTSLIPTMTPPMAYRYNLSASGAFPRDDIDSLVLSQIKTLGSGTTGTGVGTTGPDGGFYTSQTQTGLANNGYGTLNGLTGPTDSDGDAMPDYWEAATGSATNSANSQALTSTGYSLLENYLNYLAAPHVVTQTNTAVDLNLSQFATGFSAPTFAVSGATNGTVSLVNSTNAHFTPTGSFAGLGGFSFTATEGSYSLNVNVTVCVTPLVPPASAVAFNGALIGVTVTNTVVVPPANLTWQGTGGNVWNTTSSNWFNGSGPATFKNTDVVTFDDTGSNNTAITLAGSFSPGAVLFNNTKSYTLTNPGSLGGTATFSKSGSGALLLYMTNSLSGAVNLRDGLVSLISGGLFGSGPITLANNATLEIQGGGAGSTVTSAISVQAGDSATISSGQLATSFNGAISTTSTNSRLYISNSVSFGGTPASQFSGFLGTVQIVPSATLRWSATAVGNTFGALSPSFIVSGTMRPRLGGSTIQLGSIAGSGLLTGQEKDAASGGAGNVLYNIGGNNTDSTFTGTMADALSTTNPTCLVKTGTGRLTLTGNSTFTGTNAVNAGTLMVNGSMTPSLTTVNSGGTLAGIGTINGPVTIKSGGFVAPGTNGPGTLTFNGNLTNTSPNFNFDLSGSPAGANDRINLTGTLNLSGLQIFNVNLVNNALGAGTYNLIEGATNSTASGVSFALGFPSPTRQTLTLTNSAAGSNPSFVRLTVAGTAASLVWRGTSNGAWDTSTANWVNGVAPDQFYNLDAVTFDDTGANATGVTLAGAYMPATITVNAAQNYAFSGSSFTGTGPLLKLGSGTLTLNLTNSTYHGNLTIGGGTLALGGGATLGTGAVTISNNATLSLPGSGSSVFVSGTVTVPAGQTANVSSGQTANGFSGDLYSGNSSSTLNLAGGVSFSGLTSAQFDNFTGVINIQSGASLRYSADVTGKIFGSLSPTLVINGTLQPRDAGNTIQLGTISGSGTLAGAQSAAGSGDTLYVIGGNNADSTFSGNISSNSAVANSAVTLTKNGTGKLTLNGASTFTGGVTVSAGTLSVNNLTGSATGTGDMEVFTGATLTGNGYIASATTIDGGATLAPGNPTGTLTIANNLSLNDTSLVQFKLGTSSSQVVVNGALELAGLLTVTAGSGFGAGSYTLFNCSGGINGALTLSNAPSGYTYTLTNTATTVKLIVVSTNAVPPVFTGAGLNSGGLVLSGSNGTPLGNYFVLTSTNLTLPASNWTRFLTNQFDVNGNFNFTGAVGTNALEKFFRLQLP